MTSIDLSRHLRHGDTVMWGQSHAEPRTLIRNLVEQRSEFGRIRIFVGIGLSGQLLPEHADHFDFIGYGAGGTTRALANAGVLDILPVHYSRLPHLIRSGALRIDVLLLQVSPPDVQGLYSLGMAREYLVEALANARVVIGEVHPDAPWTFGGPYLTRDDFGLLIDSDSPQPSDKPMSLSPIDEAIGRHVASLVDDGATLQTGIGAIPDAALAQLRDRRDLGIHTGSIGDGLVALHDEGVITNSRKSINAGLSVAGVLMGGAAVRRFAHLNPALELRGTEYTHAPEILAQIRQLVALNSAVEVDLTGQINSESAGGRYVGAVGGIIDFLRAAGFSEGGVPIVALPSTAGARSRIVPRLTSPVSVARAESCVIVTEYGIADLRGLTLNQRIPRMISIAHPDHREAIEREFHVSRLSL
ncbi:acetyl-CoA hydrolase [Rhizobium sp. PP-F2F-G48]|uniref:acetyl-CoA hydrolase/transferase family protein n=1 Tax=Rhizobium sp. PP-F2F-G48 TaxID=2135651 RepID=UPI0010480AD6|nr:acetyl-CoA hydrolase/transferase C-terminal domain-containing protein [Rhizobium sp. PP-F2F-G48]TCM47194.1 acetyl-CoA hydrolase [Rhizobium sp. PP-F2F-G48]